MALGFMDRILRVNLSSGKISKEPLSEELELNWYGGRGLTSRLLWEEIKPGIDPLGPENRLIIATGPCNGTLAPSSSRFTMAAKSPMSGFLGDGNSGGSFGARLKYAGYDLIIVEGKADSPVYLWIDDDKVEIRNGDKLWGKSTYETKGLLEIELGDPEISVISIGQAGENLVRFATVTADLGRTFGRCGMGAVMGSKNLKAIAARGTKGVKVASAEQLYEAWKDMYKAWHGTPAVEKAWQAQADMAAASGIIPYNSLGMLPTKNYLQGTYEDVDLIKGQNLPGAYYFKRKGCFSCLTPCDHRFVIDRGPYKGTYGEAIELGQAYHFCCRIMNNNQDIMVKAAALCQEYGMDALEVPATIGMVMECFDHGILTKEDLGGLNMEWGNGPATLKLIEMIGNREGIGDLLAEGARRAADKIGKGAEDFAITTKGMAISTRDGRASKAWGLGYAVASRGADHCRSLILAEGALFGGGTGFDPAKGEVFGVPGTDVDPATEKGKGQMVFWYENVRAFQNCMEFCLFSTTNYPRDMGLTGIFAKIYSAVTGRVLSAEDILRVGERIVSVERAFNVREGLTRKDDTLPKRFLKEPMADGPAKGQVVNLDVMLDDYYQVRGWEKKTGLPTRAKLEELGMKDVADQLEKLGKLGKTV